MSNSFSQLIFNKIVEFNKYRLRDIKYYSVDDLFTVRDYVRGFNNNKKKFLQTKFQVADYAFGRLSIGDIIVEDTRFSPRYSKYFVQCDKVLEDFKQFQANSSISNVQVAPPLIEENLCLFKDKKGVEYKVEIRGVREKDKIYFKCKDLENVFEMNSLCHDILREISAYVVNTDYLLFRKMHQITNQQSKESMLYLTFSGLMKVVRNSRTGRAKEFAEWLDEIVFAAIAGSEEQRVEAAATVMNTSIEEFKKMISKHASKIACIYVLKTNMKVGNDTIYKFGFSEDLDRRMKEHESKLGDVQLESFIIMSNEHKSKAEAEFKDNMSAFNKKLDKVGFESATELLFLNTDTKKCMKTCMANLSAKYSEDNNLMIAELNNKIVDMKNNYEKEIMKLEYENKLLTDKVEHQLEIIKIKDEALTDKVEIIKMKEEMLNVYRRLTEN